MLQIDEVDARIITLLRQDGRRSNVAIARQLGVAEGTVRRRIDRMIRHRIIQIGAWADPLKVGYPNYVNIGLQVRLRDIESIAQSLAKLPEIFFLGFCTGQADLFATACFRSNEHFHEFMAKRLARIAGIQTVSTSNITKILKREHSFPVTLGDGDEGNMSALARKRKPPSQPKTTNKL